MGVIIWPGLTGAWVVNKYGRQASDGTKEKDDQMHINEDAVSFAAFSLAKILAAELLRKGVFDRQELLSAITGEIDRLRNIATPTNEDAATLLTVYCDEL
jgi:hypothetical protein